MINWEKLDTEIDKKKKGGKLVKGFYNPINCL